MRQYMIPINNLSDKSGNIIPWDTTQVQKITQKKTSKAALRATERLIEKSNLIPKVIKLENVVDEKDNLLKLEVINHQIEISKKKESQFM